MKNLRLSVIDKIHFDEKNDVVRSEGNENYTIVQLQKNAKAHRLDVLLRIKTICSRLNANNQSNSALHKKLAQIDSWIEETLRDISSDDHESKPFNAKINRRRWKNYESIHSHIKNLCSVDGNDDSLLSRFKQTILKYSEIRVPNQLIAVQPKLQLINSIEA